MSVIRSFGIQSILAAAAQPIFGTTIASAGEFAPDQFAPGQDPDAFGPKYNQSTSTFTLTTPSLGFRVGDVVALGRTGAFAYPPSDGVPDLGTIKKIVGQVVTVQGLQFPHAANDYFVLAENANAVWIVPRVTTGLLDVGNASDVSSVSIIDVIPIYNGSGVPYVHADVGGWAANPLALSEYWVKGTVGDTFVARFIQAGG